MGAGYWGKKLCKEYAHLSDGENMVTLKWIVDESRPTINSIQKEFSDYSIKFSMDYRDVLNDPEVDAVHIALPNEVHYTIGRDAIEAGKHVLIEKPMATTSREAFKLARLAEEKGKILLVGHIFRFNNAIRKVREILKNGLLGKVFYASLTWATYMEPPEERDIIFDLGPHPIDILNYLFDEWPISVDAIGGSFIRKETDNEEVAFVNLRFPDEILATMYLSWIQHGAKERSIRVVGQNATLYCNALEQKITMLSGENVKKQDESLFDSTGLVANNTIRDMQLHFIDRIRGWGPQFNSAMVGASTIRVLEAIAYAVRTRRDHRNGELQPIESPITR